MNPLVPKDLGEVIVIWVKIVLSGNGVAALRALFEEFQCYTADRAVGHRFRNALGNPYLRQVLFIKGK